MIREVLRSLAVAAAVVALVVFGLTWTCPPAAVAKNAPAESFSSGRARAHIAEFAQRPHPMGTREHARVRRYILDQLAGLGLEGEVQQALAVRAKYSPARLGIVRNVVARAVGRSDHDHPLLLMAHYDSRGMTPGASDDGFGTGAMLEVARALRAGAPLDRDVIFLFTDGEEDGLLGASAFAEQHPYAREIAAVLNLDARGNAGPALMFQTGKGSGALVAALAANAPHVAANSLSQAIYERMPNDTDLSIFLPAMPALNFANVEGFERYHSPTDTVANLDERTLQQGGEQVLAVARAFASTPELPAALPNPTYWNLGRFLVRYPAWLDVPLALLGAALAAVWIGMSIRRGSLRSVSVLESFGLALGVALASACACLALWVLAQHLHADDRLVNAARPALKDLWLYTFVALSAGVALAAPTKGRATTNERFAGALVLFAALSLVMTVALPGSGFLFTWPTLLAAGVALGFVRTASAPGAPVAVALAGPMLVIVVPFVGQVFVAFGPTAGPAVGLVVALAVSFAAPASALLCAPSVHVARAPLVLAALGLVAANLTAPFDLAYPRPETVLYALDADAGRGFWLSPDPAPPSWAAAAFSASSRGAAPIPYPLRDVVSAPAPLVTASAPTITWSKEPTVEGEAIVVIAPPPDGETLAIRLEGITSVRLDDLDARDLQVREGVAALKVFAPPALGVKLRLTGALPGHVTVRAASQRQGFPPGLTPGVRPAGSMAKPGMLPPWEGLLESDTTVVAVSASR